MKKNQLSVGQMLLASFAITTFLVLSVAGQETARERAAGLRSQLAEVQAKQTDLESRLQVVEEDLKPENIEHSLAGVGSTRPEDLREQRRRQLEIEQKNLKSQLDILGTSRTRLESAISRAEIEDYQQSGATVNTGAQLGTDNSKIPATDNSNVSTPGQKRPKQHRAKKRRPVRTKAE